MVCDNSQLFCISLSFTDSTKMEQKRFGVKISLLNELRIFQSMLKKKRRMFYTVDLTSNAGTQTQVQVYTGENVVSIPPFAPFSVRRQDYVDRSSLSVSLVVGGLCEITVKFESEEEKRAFKRDMLVITINVWIITLYSFNFTDFLL
jgi:hypothetical protein